MSEQDTLEELKMDPAELYREESFTDRRVGTIRCLIPVTIEGEDDSRRPVQYLGQTQVMTPAGALPLSFAIPAKDLREAVDGFAQAANEAIHQAVQELQDMRRESASQLYVPGQNESPVGGGGGLGGAGGGNIRLK